jgi:hypothetical protein
MTVLDPHCVDLWWGKACRIVSHAWGGSGVRVPSVECERPRWGLVACGLMC